MDEERVPLAEQAARLIEMVGAQNESLAALDTAVVNLTSATRQNKRLIRLLAVLIVLVVVSLGGLGYAIAKSRQASDDNKATIRATCLAGNETRAANVELWRSTINSNPAATPEAQARADQFLAVVRKTFAPRDCG